MSGLDLAQMLSIRGMRAGGFIYLLQQGVLAFDGYLVGLFLLKLQPINWDRQSHLKLQYQVSSQYQRALACVYCHVTAHA